MIRFAQVIKVHPERRTVDLVYLDNRVPVSEVQVLSGAISSDSGVWSVPDVNLPASQASAGGVDTPGRKLIAAVDRAGIRPVVLGFLQPNDGQLVFLQANREVTRHPSGAYTTVAPDGSIEIWHPSGAYLRIGTGAHEDLAPLTAGAPWSVPPGAPPAQITLATDGFTLTIEPGGKTTLVSQASGSFQFAGPLTFTSGGDMTFLSGGGLAFTAALTTTMTGSGTFSVTAPAIKLND